MSTPLSTANVTIIIGASIRRGKYLLTINDQELALTRAQYELFLQLALYRLKQKSGLTPPPACAAEKPQRHTEIRRLRLALESVGINGKEFVIHGRNSCYFLANCRIDIQPSLKELAPHHVSKALVDELLQCAKNENQSPAT